MAVDGVTNLDVAHVPDKTADDTMTGNWSFTKSVGTPGGQSYVVNGNLERWFGGTAAAPSGWTINGSGATVARDATNKKLGLAAAGLTRVGNDCYLGQNVAAFFGPAAWWQSRKVTFGCWVRATVASRARLTIADGVGTTSSGYHTGGSAFEWLSVTRDLNAAATQVEVRLVVDTGNTTAQFDGATLVLGAGIPEYVAGVLDAIAEATVNAVNWGFNGDFEIWGAGTSAAPTKWTLTGAGASVARDATNFKLSVASAAVTRAGTDCYIAQDPTTFAGYGPIGRWQGRVVTFGCWVRATVGSAAQISINDGVGTSTSPAHSGGSAFEWLQVTRLVDASATKVEMRCEVAGSNTTAQFDGATLVVGSYVQDFIPSSWRGRKHSLIFQADATAGQAQATTRFLAPGGQVSTEIQGTMVAPFACVARNLRGIVDTTPAAGQTVILTLRKDETTDTALTVTIDNGGGRTKSDTTNEVALTATQLFSIKSVTSATVGTRFIHATFELEEIP